MAAKGRRLEGQQQLTKQQGESNKAYNQFVNPLQQEAPGLATSGASERANILANQNNMATGGGISPEEQDRLRALYAKAGMGYSGPGDASGGAGSDFTDVNKRYTALADTGGYSGEDIQRVRAQAASAAPSLYNALKDQQNLRNANMGANAGGGAIDFKSARAAAQDSAKARLGANIGLADTIRAGKLQGTQGLESTATTSGQQALQRAGLANQFNLGVGDINSRGSQFQASGEADLLSRLQQGREAGTNDLLDTYKSSYAPQDENRRLQMQALGMHTGDISNYAQMYGQNDQTNAAGTGAGSVAFRNIMSAVGAVGGAMTGLGAIGAIGKGIGAAKNAASIGRNIGSAASFVPGAANQGVGSNFGRGYKF